MQCKEKQNAYCLCKDKQSTWKRNKNDNGKKTNRDKENQKEKEGKRNLLFLLNQHLQECWIPTTMFGFLRMTFVSVVVYEKEPQRQ